MIGSLRGILLEKQPPLLLLEVGGVGYEVFAPMTSFYQLPPAGKEVLIHTHLVVREDAQTLFGFTEKSSRELFRELIRVNGVGPKMALAILSALDGDELVSCLQQNRLDTLVKVPGIGRKTAERLLVELRDRLVPKHSTKGLGDTGSYPTGEAARPSIQQDAESALLALGYKPQEAEKAIATAMKSAGASSSEELIRLALRNMLAR